VARRYQRPNLVSFLLRSLDRFKAIKGALRHHLNLLTGGTSNSRTTDRSGLIDGDQLTRLMIRHGVGCGIEETLYIKKVDEEFFE
jgi:restriction system protein